ncbi:MAG: thiamine pyrophosphate-dependent enzyme [Granulosicoccus sp.]
MKIEVNDQRDNHGKVVGTELQSADYAGMAKAFGLYAERVEKAEDLPAAIERALANTPALLDVVLTPDVRSSDGKTGLAWVPDLQALEAWDEAERRWRHSWRFFIKYLVSTVGIFSWFGFTCKPPSDAALVRTFLVVKCKHSLCNSGNSANLSTCNSAVASQFI